MRVLFVHARRAKLAQTAVNPGHAQVVRQQFFQRQALLRGVATLYQGGHIGIGWRAVNKLQCAFQRDLGDFLADIIGCAGQQAGWQQLIEIEIAALQAAQGLVGEAVPARLAKPLGAGVDRGQAVGQRRVAILGNALVAGVDHLQAAEAGANLAKHPQPGAGGHRFLLRGAEMEEAQRDQAGAVGDNHHQHGAARRYDGCVLDRAFHLRGGAGVQPANGVNPGAVLVAQGQVEQQVLDTVDAAVFQLGGNRRAHALQSGQVRGLVRHG